jgi:hypothetical protein
MNYIVDKHSPNSLITEIRVGGCQYVEQGTTILSNWHGSIQAKLKPLGCPNESNA